MFISTLPKRNPLTSCVSCSSPDDSDIEIESESDLSDLTSDEEDGAADSDISDSSEVDELDSSEASDTDGSEDSDGPDDLDEGDVAVEELKSMLKLWQEEMDNLTRALEVAKAIAKDATTEVSTAKKKRMKAQKEHNCLCAKARNEVSDVSPCM